MPALGEASRGDALALLARGGPSKLPVLLQERGDAVKSWGRRHGEGQGGGREGAGGQKASGVRAD